MESMRRGLMDYNPLECYGVIGDLHTVAFVGMDGSIDFMCFPRFDSPSLFGALLDVRKGGRFKLAPVMHGENRKQFYFPDSMILLTRFFTEDGIAEISDFMAITELGHHHAVIRRAKSVRGDVSFRMELAPSFDYGRAAHHVEAQADGALFISQGADRSVVRLRTSVPLRIENGKAFAEFRLRAGASAGFVLEAVGNDDDSPSKSADYLPNSFKQTLNFWQNWSSRSRYRGRWRETVNRSAMTLKLLTFAPAGSIVAAPTFGLPEEIGGVRNWDYRYTWIRDASFTVFALLRLGYTDEATAFMRWIEERCREPDPERPLQVMYRVDGSHDLPETILEHWEGYRGSRPVRIGNAASRQLQLDIYGELMDAIYLYNQLEPISYDFWKRLVTLIDWVCGHWREPDYGLWEVRIGPAEFLHSKVMCWVAIDRALKLARHRSFPAPWDPWTRTRDEIYRFIYEEFWDNELGAFVQFKGAKTVDASALLMPLVKIIGPNDPRWRSTLNVINQSLVEDSLVFRYNVLKGAQDGLPGREGTFSMCSFWNVECLAQVGDLKKARLYFEKALSYANHLGLFAEQIGREGEQLGNFPQAFTHLAVITAAWHLNQSLDEQP